MFCGRKKVRKTFPPKLSWKTLAKCVFARFQMPVIVSQRKNLHTLCYHDLWIFLLYNTQSKITFLYYFLPRFSSFVDSYYSPCGPLGVKPGRFYYRNAKFWTEFGYGKYVIVPFCQAPVTYQALFSPWVFWLDCVSAKYEPWLDQTLPICRQSVAKRCDYNPSNIFARKRLL